MTTNLVIDVIVDPEEGATKDLAVDGIGCCDVQLDSGVRNTILDYLGRCERGVRSGELVSRKVVGQGGQLSGFVGRRGRRFDEHDGGKHSSSYISAGVDSSETCRNKVRAFSQGGKFQSSGQQEFPARNAATKSA